MARLLGWTTDRGWVCAKCGGVPEEPIDGKNHGSVIVEGDTNGDDIFCEECYGTILEGAFRKDLRETIKVIGSPTVTRMGDGRQRLLMGFNFTGGIPRDDDPFSMIGDDHGVDPDHVLSVFLREILREDLRRQIQPTVIEDWVVYRAKDGHYGLVVDMQRTRQGRCLGKERDR